MEVIKLTSKHNLIGKGTQGKFFQIDTELGVKILGKGFKTAKQADCSKESSIASLEIEQGLLGENCSLFSQVYEYKIVLYKGKYYPGILMEYFQGEHPAEENLYNIFVSKEGNIIKGKPSKKDTDLISYIANQNEFCGLDLDDLHSENIIITPEGQVKIIDVSPRGYIEDSDADDFED